MYGHFKVRLLHKMMNTLMVFTVSDKQVETKALYF